MIRVIFAATQIRIKLAPGVIGTHERGCSSMANITVYTTRLCPYCQMAKSLLRSKGAVFEEIDVGCRRELRSEMCKRPAAVYRAADLDRRDARWRLRRPLRARARRQARRAARRLSGERGGGPGPDGRYPLRQVVSRGLVQMCSGRDVEHNVADATSRTSSAGRRAPTTSRPPK